MEQNFWSRKRKWLIGFGIFLVIMFTLTIVSKSIYAYQLPLVETQVAEERYIEHTLEEEGIVIAGGETPVNTQSGLRIQQIFVQTGDKVAAGDVLFQIDMEDLKQIIEKKQSEVAKLDTQIQTLLENEQLAQQKKEIELARAKEDYELQARIGDTKLGRAKESYVQAEEALEDAREDGQISEEEEKALNQSLQQAAYAEADSMEARDKENRDLERRMEDLEFPEEETSTLELYQIDREQLEQDLNDYKSIQEAGGQICASQDGIVTRIMTEVGGRTSDTAVLLLSDGEKPCQLKVNLSKEQKKVVSLGDTISVKLDSSRERDCQIDYLTEEGTGVYALYISLPEGLGIPGESGMIRASKLGEKYMKCVSTLAVHESNNNSFVYMVGEREGILGSEYYIREQPVKVLDRNDNYVAIEAEAITKDSKIVVSSNKEFEKGNTIRCTNE